jgi:glycosyltransferase involved in cell wall biosynthesis
VLSASSRPQVVHIATRYLRGGSEGRIRDIVQSFPEADHHVILGSESDLDLARRHLRPRTLTMLPALVREPDIAKDIIAFGKLASLLWRSPFDLVVTHQSKAGVLGRMAARVSGGTPVVHSLSMTSFGPGYPGWQDVAYRTLEARLARLTTTYAVAGRDLASRYRSIGVPPSKLNVVRSSVRLPSITTLTEASRQRLCDDLGIPVNRHLVLYLGSLEPRKNVLSLPSFLARLLALESPDRPFLVVAGEGPLASQLERKLEAMGLSGDAALLGFVTEPEPLVVMANAIVLLSTAEGISQVLVQAAAAGTPFVAYAVDGTQELLDEGAVGAVVPLGDVGAAARATFDVIRGRRGSAPSIDLSGWDEAEITAGYRRLLTSALSGRTNRGATVSTPTTEHFVLRPPAPVALPVGEPDSGTRA